MPDASSSNLNVAESLYQVKLLGALRNGDAPVIHQLLAEIGKDKRRSAEEDVDLGAAALHLAIRCASCETVGLLLSHRSISPNAAYPRGSDTTALHLAASIGRADVVNLLLEQDGIDDTLRDCHGRTCKDVARGKDVQKAIRDSRALLTASYRSILHSYIASSPTQSPPRSLIDLLHSPRARLVDLSYLDPTTGRSLLHEAARRNDLSLIDVSIKAGADVFVRDKRGKAVGESGSGNKDDKVRVFLRQFTNQDTSLLDHANTGADPPTLKGYLSKYTNVARGYNTRWFVLKNGVLSYYRHQDDENIASRGSIAMKSAMLRYSSATEKLRFEVHSTPGRGQQKWFIKGNHAVEVGRWTQAIARSIEHARRAGSGHGQSLSGSESDGRSLKSVGASFRASISRQRLAPPTASLKDSGSSIHDSLEEEETPGVGQRAVAPEDSEDEDLDERADDSSDSHSERSPPHESSFALHGNSTAAQAELTIQLLSSLVLPPDAPPALHDVRQALEESASMTARMVGEHVRMIADREEWWRDALTRERTRGALWEESLQVVVQEGAALENELKNRRRRGSRAPAEGSGATGTDRGRSTIRIRGDRQFGLFSPPPFNLEQPPATRSGLPPSSSNEPPSLENASTQPSAPSNVPSHPDPGPAFSASPTQDDDDSIIDTDGEDEFFDAIESNLLQNVVVADALVKVPVTSTPTNIEIGQYEGYKHLREKLPMEKDTRPPTSLWSILKNSIGKDLTKISFPVFFNEPTSMLQRMAEDMEFSECLDAASVEPDPHKRIAFVAAFAMSNYSSTIGRIAKPFNPMLGETFEYVRLDKKYRYMSEQVSHHPPISACWAESPSWYYYGEVDAQNKFMGKSFEIRPTGIAHAELIIPEKFGGPDYPRAKGAMGQGRVVEHYSWKKVTTNVSGFILGSPTIDHYGDMTVVNHRTGDTCVLSFKPRGWRGKDAFEILGQVMDASGTVMLEIAGRWNSQLVARAIGTGIGVLHPDVAVQTPASPSTSREFIRLWRNTEKPTAPFNLTPFAITLNDLPEKTLRPFICPTDCRLRPDQRAFELGKYERANELKSNQEDFQRMTRRAREEGRIAPHRPRWFEAKTEPETGERVWEPVRTDSGELAYWKEREAVWRESKPWSDVETIFIDDEP
ncbi:Oxysterol-binding protein-domain-containing protein [Phellopilus nigrolimitatus]|nr:Oxysterol-binding protein-domain-containing protein [Phellopilus nigrolimitatus]